MLSIAKYQAQAYSRKSLSPLSLGIAGFARLAPGDVFEVVIKHGTQKWKSKGRIEKSSAQKWDNPEFTFKCLVGETLSIKVSITACVLDYMFVLQILKK